MKVATHSGSFHADELFALAALTLLDPAVEIVRTRDADALAAADLRVDVGFRDDPATGDFDHHQKGGAGERPNGVRYASFGLVWREFGARVATATPTSPPARPVARAGRRRQRHRPGRRRADRRGRAADDGQRRDRRPQPPLGRGPDAARTSAPASTPPWSWPAGSSSARSRRRPPAPARVRPPSRRPSAARRDPRVIELDARRPRGRRSWSPRPPTRCSSSTPSARAGASEAVPRELGSFTNRRDLPEAWAGLEGPDLARLTGVQDALFAHAKRFLAVRGRERASRCSAGSRRWRRVASGSGSGLGVGAALCGRLPHTRRLWNRRIEGGKGSITRAIF